MKTVTLIALICAIISVGVLAYKIISSWITIRSLKKGNSDITIVMNSGKKVHLKSKYKETSPQELIDSMSVLFGD